MMKLACAALVMYGASVLLAADPATTTATTQAAPDPLSNATTRPDESLLKQIARTVELAQHAIRAKKPAPPKLPQNSLQKNEAARAARAARAAATQSTDPLARLEAELIGKEGLIAVQVKDVHDNHRPPMFIGLHLPAGIADNKGKYAYLITAFCDNPTATYFSDEQRRSLWELRNQPSRTGRIRATAERAKPLHALYIFSDDPAVRDWRPDTRHLIRATVLDVRLTEVFNGYVRASVVLRMGDR